MESRRNGDWRWILLLTLIVLFSFWKILFTKQFSVLWGWEVVNQTYAWYTFAATYIQKGILPIWDPYRFAGNTFIGEMQTGLFYPFKIALYLAPLGSNGLLSERVFNIFFVFSHWLAAFLTFLFARRLGLSGLASLVAGVCFGAGGFVLKVGWPNILDAAPWLPLVLLFFLRAFEAKRFIDKALNATASGLALGMTFLAGSLHIAIMDLIVVSSFGLFAIWSGADRKNFVPVISTLSIVVIISILFGAVQVLPSIEYGSRAFRWVGGDSPIRSFQKVPYAILGDEARYGPESIFSFLFGGADTGNHESSNYFGVMPLLLVIIGIWKQWSNRWVKYFALLATLSYLYTWGSFSFLHGVLYLVPFLDMAREPGRFIYLTHFAMAVLAGYGVNWIFDGRRSGDSLSLSTLHRLLKWSIAVFAVLLSAASLHLLTPPPEWTYFSFFLIAASYALLVYAERTRGSNVAAVLLVSLVAMDSYAFNQTIKSKIEAQEQNNDHLSQLVNDRRLADFFKSREEMARVHFDVPSSPNIGNAYGIPVTWAMSATMLVDYAHHLGHPRMNQLLNVRYTVRNKQQPSAGVPVYSDDVWSVFENKDAFPRAWIVYKVEVDPSKERPLKRLDEASFDLRNTAIVESELDIGPSNLVSSVEDVEWITYEPNRLELKTNSPAPGLLVLSEVFYPGWIAEVDGEPATVCRVDGFLRGVPVGQGIHRVTLRYRPRSVQLGGLLTVLTLLGTIGVFFVPALRGK